MSYLSSFKRLSRFKQLAVLLIAAIFTWTVGLPTFFTAASAAALTSVSDTASSSAPLAATNHYIAWTAPNAITDANATTTINFDPSGSAFTFGQLGFSDLTMTGATLVTDFSGCNGAASQMYLYATTSDTITLAVCPTDTVSSGAKTLNISNNKITNPSGTGSYVIRIFNGATDFGDTRVAIISAVTVTAAVDTSLTFTINAVLPGVSDRKSVV